MKKDSIKVNLVGGLGNQLFIWAAATAISKRTDLSLILDASRCTQWGFQLEDFGIEAKLLPLLPPDGLLPTRVIKQDSKVINSLRFLRQKIRNYGIGSNFWERNNSFDSRVFNIRPGQTLCGYFQSYKYFDFCKEEIKDHLLKNFIATKELELLENQFSKNAWVAIDYRRGDYEEFSKTLGLLSENYFIEALAFLSNEFPSLKKIVFSDDVSKAKLTFPNCDGYIGVEQLSSPAARLILMSKADAIIGSNSTFGWWAAYLSDAQDRFKIFPEPWFRNSKINPKDLVPLTWMRIKNN